MLYYLLDARSERFHWRDIEALPLYGFVLLLIVGSIRVTMELTPVTQAIAIKAFACIGLLALRVAAGGMPAADGEGQSGS